MKTEVKTKRTLYLCRGFLISAFLWPGFFWTAEVVAQKVRVAMPAKSMTFLNFYVGDKFGVYKAEGLEVSLEVIKTEVGVAGMVAGEIDYTSAIGSAMRAAVTSRFRSSNSSCGINPSSYKAWYRPISWRRADWRRNRFSRAAT